MSKQSVKATINANVKQNGKQEITGQTMNAVLNKMADEFASDAEQETLRAEAELQRQANEIARQEAEAARIAAENGRISAESDREAAEEARNEVETARYAAEEARETAESSRRDNEVERKLSENERKGEEYERQQAETSRTASEVIRESNEDARKAAENAREANELVRKSDESGRLSEEAVRGANEIARKNAETEREKAEAQRQSDTAAMISQAKSDIAGQIAESQEATDTAVANAEAATEAANTAAAQFAATIVQEEGSNTDKVMSQKVVTDELNALLADINRMSRDFGRYAGETSVVMSILKSGKYVGATTGQEVSNSGYAISNPFEVLTGDIIFVPSATPVAKECSVVSSLVTNTYDKAILYTYAYDSTGRITTATADFDKSVYTAHYESEEATTPDYWLLGEEQLSSLPSTHEVTESFYEPLVKQSVAGVPDGGGYVYLASRPMTIVVSAFTATVNGGTVLRVGWGIFKNIATNFVGHPQQRVIADALCQLAGRVEAVEDKFKNGVGFFKADKIFIRRKLEGLNIDGNFTLSAAGAPSADLVPDNYDAEHYGEWKGVPQFVGQQYVDTANKIGYMACGTSSVSDWKRITNA